MFLADTSQKVIVVIRGEDLGKSMSSYLCDRVLNHPKIELIKNSEVTEIHGTRCVEAITRRDHTTGELSQLSCTSLFCFIGAQPHTAWLPKGVLLDDKGYIRTGSAIPPDQIGDYWKLDRHPCDLETTIPGILAAGDVRSGSTKRCGFAVGDGSMAVTCMHRYFSTIR